MSFLNTIILLSLLLAVSVFADDQLVRSDGRDIYQKIKKIYQTDLDQRLIKLSLKVYSSKNPNAAVMQNPYHPRKKSILLNTGLIKGKCQDYDSLVLIICHEFGHLLGEKRYHNHKVGYRTTFEGESDYWAAQKCAPAFYKKYAQKDNGIEFDNEVSEICAHEKNDQDYEVCQRVLQAGLNISKCVMKDEPYNYGAKINSEASYKTPSTYITNVTWRRHPQKQCRLDTYLAGFFNKPRPLCWYSPKDKR